MQITSRINFTLSNMEHKYFWSHLLLFINVEDESNNNKYLHSEDFIFFISLWKALASSSLLHSTVIATACLLQFS